jgi:uncharacterized protein (TIGR00297 family)
MDVSYLAAFIIITAGMLISVLKKKLTVAATFTGGLLAVIIFTGGGLTGIGLLAAFFIVGVGATGWKLNIKMKNGLAEEKQGKRNAGQVFANAGAAAILALLAKYNPGAAEVLLLMLAASFSAAAADTLSSELGNVYGRRYYHILSFKRMQRGANGAVSLQGTISGIMGSAAIALVYVFGTGWNGQHFLVIIVAGTIGNIADSILGLTLENKGLLTNNIVNFLNTAVGAAVAGVLDKL